MDDDGFVDVQMVQSAKFCGKIAIYSHDAIYMGDSRNYLYGTYDNGDDSLVFISKNPLAFDLVTGRDYPYTADELIERGKFTSADLQELHRLNAKLLTVTDARQTGELSFKGVPFTAAENVLRRMMPEEYTKFKGVNSMTEKDKTAEMPASDAQKGFMVSLGCKFNDDVTKGEAVDIIKERLEKRNVFFEKMNAPASKDQIDTLKENNCTYSENITVGQASKIIGQLPATDEQKEYMDKLKIEYKTDVTRNEAAKFIENKMRLFEERDMQPATEKQIAAIKQHGLEPAENITRGEARAQIYLSPATEKQLSYLNAKNIEYDSNKICFGRASTLIENYKKELEAERSQPASEKQLAVLDDRNIAYKDGITKGEAYDLIKQDIKIKEAVTDKQTELCSKLGIELPANANRGYAAEVIDIKLRQNAISEYKPGENERPNVFSKYMELANKQYEKANDFGKIDDKKIAAELMKQGFDKNQVRNAIIEKSPAGKDFGRADELVNAASKMPSVVKAQTNAKGAEMGR